MPISDIIFLALIAGPALYAIATTTSRGIRDCEEDHTNHEARFKHHESERNSHKFF